MAVHGNRDILGPSAIQTPIVDDLGAEGIQKSVQLDTTGANGGLGHSESGQRDLQCYRETKAAISGTIIEGGSYGIEIPTGDCDGDHSDRFRVSNEF